MDDVSIAVFAKTPGISFVKTRLAAKIGRDRAECFYRLSLQALLSELVQLPECFKIQIATAEKGAERSEFWTSILSKEERNSRLNFIEQGEGELGVRLSRVYLQLLESTKKVLLIGADSPQLPQSLFLDAQQLLDESDWVLAPAMDGGYVLFGSKLKLKSDLWLRVPYSSENTFKKFVRELSLLGKGEVLESFSDVDCFSDLPILVKEIFPNKMSEDLEKSFQKTSGRLEGALGPKLELKAWIENLVREI